MSDIDTQLDEILAAIAGDTFDNDNYFLHNITMLEKELSQLSTNKSKGE